jgi:RNA polymerase sigma factor (sigma-70 family)
LSRPDDVARALAKAHRSDWAVVLAATACVVRDLDLAEECVQEAYASALESWVRDGIPEKPAAWLTTIAKRRAMDAVRRQRTLRTKLPLLVVSEDAGPEGVEMGRRAVEDGEESVPDARLRVIFMCCHPALSAEAQMALTLRLICGLSTADVARAFLVSESTMAARLTRAKRKIAIARIPVRVPRAAELPDRLHAVLGVLHLLFTMGHTAPSGEALMRTDVVDETVRLTRILCQLMPDEREARGLLALLVVTDARRSTRVDAHGRLLTLAEQDRSRWDRPAIAEAHALIVEGLRGGRPGRYVLQAAIASLHAEAPSYEETDWLQILRLYDELLFRWPSPVIALNRAVALSMVSGPEPALAALAAIESDGQLAGYHYLFAVKADFLRRLGHEQEALTADLLALELSANDAERALLAARLSPADRIP